MNTNHPMIRDGGNVPVAGRGAYPLRGNNRVRPLVDGEPAFRRICEAVESARKRVWVTVAYLDRDLEMPDDRGSFFDVLDAAVARGIEVRALFWREPTLPEIEPGSNHFPGNSEERRFLAERGSRFLARWDRLPDAYCQHQKSWLIDAGEAGQVAFVGGINLDRHSVSPPGHSERETPHIHDVYVEFEGPATTDVHHNFVQRWNEASERGADDGCWPDTGCDDLAFPDRVAADAGVVPVQISRTVLPKRYSDATPTPGGQSFPVAEGETSGLDLYLSAVAGARSSIYIENQAIGSPAVADALQAAVDRGVEVVFLVPGDAHPVFVEARRDPRAAFYFDKLAVLDQSERFTLAALAGSRDEGNYEEIFVHSKIILVDDTWAMIGSTNVAERSFHGDTELNAAFWDGDTVRALRATLFAEHLGRDTAGQDDNAALRLFRGVALANRDRRARGEPLEGLAYAVRAERYGT